MRKCLINSKNLNKRNSFLNIVLLLGATFSFIPTPSFSLQESVPSAADPRIRNFFYAPDEIYIYRGYFKYSSFIEFEPGEEIRNISMGNNTGWSIQPTGSRLYLKPVDYDATTNMTLMTNKRMYHFELYAEQAENIRSEGLSFITRFEYPDDGYYQSSLKDYEQKAADYPDLDDPNLLEKYNFNYTITGDRMIAPLKVFDDGEFTFMQFRGTNADIPAIFLVDKKGNESLINYRMVGPYVVVERAAQQFTLRHGEDQVACVFNEANPLEMQREREPWLGVF